MELLWLHFNVMQWVETWEGFFLPCLCWKSFLQHPCNKLPYQTECVINLHANWTHLNQQHLPNSWPHHRIKPCTTPLAPHKLWLYHVVAHIPWIKSDLPRLYLPFVVTHQSRCFLSTLVLHLDYYLLSLRPFFYHQMMEIESPRTFFYFISTAIAVGDGDYYLVGKVEFHQKVGCQSTTWPNTSPCPSLNPKRQIQQRRSNGVAMEWGMIWYLKALHMCLTGQCPRSHICLPRRHATDLRWKLMVRLCMQATKR